MDMNLFKKINAIRKEFAVVENDEGIIRKSGYNQFAGYAYFELSDILPKAMELCDKYGVLPLISFTAELAIMTIYDTDSGNSLQISSPLTEANLKGCHPIQNTGAAETYSRRYLWFAFLEVIEHDQLDSTQGKDERPSAAVRTTPPSAAPAKDKRPASTFDPRKIWKSVLEFYGYDFGKSKDDKDNVDAMTAAHALFDPYAKSIADLTPEKGKAIMERLENMKASAGPEAWQDDGEIA